MYDPQPDRLVLAAISEVRQEQKLMVAGFNVMLDLLQSQAVVLEQILEAISADPEETENPLADALRELAASNREMAASVNANTRAVEELPARLTVSIIDAMEERE